MGVFNASVREGTNEVISSSSSSWGNIKSNAFFKFKSEPSIFGIQKIEQIHLSYDFETISLFNLKINDDIGFNLCNGDEIFILYKEYKLITIFNIIEKGVGYKSGDKIKLDTDFPCTDVSSGVSEHSILEVEEVDSIGGILKIKIVNKGRYLKEPQENVSAIGGKGKGAIFNCVFEEINSKNILDRTVIFVEYNNIPCTIGLQTAISNGITKGKIMCEKWKIYLSSKVEKNIISSPYEIIQNFTPNIRLPLLAQNSFSKETVINQSFTTIDSEIKQLKDEVEKLKSIIVKASSGS